MSASTDGHTETGGVNQDLAIYASKICGISCRSSFLLFSVGTVKIPVREAIETARRDSG